MVDCGVKRGLELLDLGNLLRLLGLVPATSAPPVVFRKV